MIKRLILNNWRSYEDATVEFHPGTTFVVASNGVGKTSLIEAARWALFGTLAPGGNLAVRAGAASARATVELELPDGANITVERTLTAKARGTNAHPVVHLNGARIRPEEFDQCLVGAYKADRAFLAGLTMPAADRDQGKLAALHLEDHLGHYFGVDGLRNAIDKLEALRKATALRIKKTKEAGTVSARQLAELQSAVERTALLAEQAAEHHRALRARLNEAQERERFETEMQKWKVKHATWAEAVERLATNLPSVADRPITTDNLDEVLEERQSGLGRQLEDIRVALAVNETKKAALTANDERLETAHEDCPVCRRPLDEATVVHAHAANTREIAAIQDSTRELKDAEVTLLAQREQINAARAEWRRIPHPGERPQGPPTADGEPISAAEAAQMTETALTALVDAHANHAQAKAKLEDAHGANETMHQLELLFGQEAKLRVAIEATEATLAELIAQTIRPLADEVNQRWKGLFPSRGGLNTHSNGEITRDIDGHPLPHDSFSTGERMGATIILRLLVAQMVTAADFCWFDEPLEHLDPDVRRKMANLLARSTGGESTLRQVVVTTYEEPLARHLQARDNQRVQLIDVRQPG
jgi:DNA repair exonuclease SbcCD ATPase subunit